MKRVWKYLGVFCIVAILVTSIHIMQGYAVGEESKRLHLHLSQGKTIINGLLKEEQCFVSVTEWARVLGGTFVFNYSTLEGKLIVNTTEIVFRLDNPVATWNGMKIVMPANMQVISNRFMVPLSTLLEKWNAKEYARSLVEKDILFPDNTEKMYYYVMSGDSLWKISKEFTVGMDILQSMNELQSDMIYPGQKLLIQSGINPVKGFEALTSSGVNFRSGPGTGYSILSYLLKGTTLSVIGKKENWYQVILNGVLGYIHKDFIMLNQVVQDNASISRFFEKSIPVDTSGDFVTYSDYFVKAGDTLWSISNMLGITLEELCVANGINSSTGLTLGQILKIPVHTIAKKEFEPGKGEVLDWFSQGQYVFPIGSIGELVDASTGRSFWVQRTIGAGHSDTETLTSQDTQIMKEIFSGWNWIRKPFVLKVNGRQFAVSVAGMPHAGLDNYPALQNVYNRSDNYGYGPNYDFIKGNGMDGHFDLYFLNALRHKDYTIDASHQKNVLIAGGLR